MIARLALLLGGPALGGRTGTGSAAVADAHETLVFWRRRLSQLPWHRRAARREARSMVARSRAQLVRANLEQRGFGYVAVPLEPLVVALGRGRRAHLRWLWLFVLRRAWLARWRLLAVAILGVGSLVALVVLVVSVDRLLPV